MDTYTSRKIREDREGLTSMHAPGNIS